MVRKRTESSLVDLHSLKQQITALGVKEREELRKYIDALNSYTPQNALEERLWKHWTLFQQAARELSGDNWPALGKLPQDLRRRLEDKIDEFCEVERSVELTVAGSARFCQMYLHGLAETGAPLTPKTLGNWSVGPRAFLYYSFPYPRTIQRRVLNTGLTRAE